MGSCSSWLKKTKQKLQSKSKCISCSEDTSLDEKAIRCAKLHQICKNCAKNQVKMQLQTPEETLPIKCPECKSEILDQQIEAVLEPSELDEQTRLLMNYCPQKFLNDSEEAYFCSLCSQQEIRAKGSCQLFICIKCGNAKCLICQKHFKYQEQYGENSEEEKELLLHFEHMKLAPLKALWDQVMKKSAQMGCPGCGLSGIKDEKCLHMNCKKCGSNWCQFCGIQVKEKGYLEHNTDWVNNQKHCPANFAELDNVFPEWNEQIKEDYKYLIKFHEIRKVLLLRQLLSMISEADWQNLEKQFNEITALKINVQEVRSMDTKETKFFLPR